MIDNMNPSLGPCRMNPCRASNTFCHAKSEEEYRCVCDSGYLPINSSAEKNGCSLISNAALKVSLHMKDKDQNINSNIAQKCGPNAGFVNKACYCFANSFEETRGDANKQEKGCKSKDFLNSKHALNLFLSDPCERKPCKGENTICIST